MGSEALALAESRAVTLTDQVPGIVGDPEMRPEVLIDSPGGKLVVENMRVPPCASLPWICRLTEVPTGDVWTPASVSVIGWTSWQSAGARFSAFGVPRPVAMS